MPRRSHRKHAIRLLGARQKRAAPERRARRRYGNAVREALIAVWEASDRVCSKRLEPLVAVLLPALERHGRLAIDAEVRRLLLEISPASMDRLLSEVWLVASGGRRRRAGFSSAVRRAVPVLAHAEVAEESKVRLRQLHAQADPVLLLAEIRAAQAELGERVDRRGTETAQAEPIIVAPNRFAASLKTAWREGERRATHRRPYRRRKPVPKRPSMLDEVQDQSAPGSITSPRYRRLRS